MPTFCRHGRFVERCPICSKTLPGAQTGARSGPAARERPTSRQRGAVRERGGATGLRVRREVRSLDDGYRSPLVPGLRSSEDASRLATEIGFSSGRLLALAADPPGLYGRVRELAPTAPEEATWLSFLIAYLSPVEGEEPFAGIEAVVAVLPSWESIETDGDPPVLASVAVGSRSAHDPMRGGTTLQAYAQWVRRWGRDRGDGAAAGAEGAGAGPGPSTGKASQRTAFRGDDAWSSGRRFERLFERLALPGLTRAARYELLLLLGRLGLYELRAESLQLAAGRGPGAEDPTTAAAKRVFGIADPLLLERRAAALAEAAGAPIEALDLALANWAAPSRATAGFPHAAADEAAGALAAEALGL